MLHDAKKYPNDPTSWKLTPQRVGRVYFNTLAPEFPLKPAYDVRRESILTLDPSTGREEQIWGGEIPVMEFPPEPGLTSPTTSRGDSTARASTDPAPAHCKDDVVFPPEVIAEFSDDMLFPMSDREVYGQYAPVRSNSMRVQDIPPGPAWNDLSDAMKGIEQLEYSQKVRDEAQGQHPATEIRRSGETLTESCDRDIRWHGGHD